MNSNMRRLLGMLFLITILTIFVGCSGNKEIEANVTNEENIEDENIEEVEEKKILGVIAVDKNMNEEEIAIEEDYPKVINDGGLEYTVEAYDGEFMSNHSVYIRTGPGEDFEHVGYLRPTERADAFEVT